MEWRRAGGNSKERTPFANVSFDCDNKYGFYPQSEYPTTGRVLGL